MFRQKIFENLNDFITQLKNVYKEDNIKQLQKRLHKNMKFINIDTNIPYKLHLPQTDIYFTIWDDEKSQLISVLKLSAITKFVNLYTQIAYTIIYVSTHNQYKQMGLAKKVVNMCFNRLHDLNIEKIIISPYTVDGFAYLKHIFYNNAEIFNLSIEDNNYVSIHDI